MSALRDWLTANKLDAVADALEAADIDLDVLPELTEADLAELGLSLGNRRRLLKAIAETGTARGRRAAPADAADRGRAPPGHGDVLRSGRFDRAVGRDRPRASAAT